MATSYRNLKDEMKEAIEIFSIKETVFFRYQNKVMPCVKIEEHKYKIKSVLYWHMVEKKINRISKLANHNKYADLINLQLPSSD